MLFYVMLILAYEKYNELEQSEAARGLGVLVEVGFSLILVNQGVWGRALTSGGPRWRRNRTIAIRVKNKTYMTERIRK